MCKIDFIETFAKISSNWVAGGREEELNDRETTTERDGATCYATKQLMIGGIELIK